MRQHCKWMSRASFGRPDCAATVPRAGLRAPIRGPGTGGGCYGELRRTRGNLDRCDPNLGWLRDNRARALSAVVTRATVARCRGPGRLGDPQECAAPLTRRPGRRRKCHRGAQLFPALVPPISPRRYAWKGTALVGRAHVSADRAPARCEPCRPFKRLVYGYLRRQSDPAGMPIAPCPLVRRAGHPRHVQGLPEGA